MKLLTSLPGILRQSAAGWINDRIPGRSASLAFYALFSLAPLMTISVAILGTFINKAALRSNLNAEVAAIFGPQTAQALDHLVTQASRPGSNIMMSILSIVLLGVSAIGVFVEMKDALNTIWKVRLKPGRGILGFLGDYLAPLSMIVGIGFLLLVSLIISAGLSAMGHSFAHGLPWAHAVLGIVNFLLSFLVITLLFAMIFRVLPNVDIPWSDVWFGAACSSLLFSLGRFLIGMYLAKASLDSYYGAAGPLVAILIWVYYSSQILYFGAELAHVYAVRRGNPGHPDAKAVADTGNGCEAQPAPA